MARYAERADLTQLSVAAAALAAIPTADQDAALDSASAQLDTYLRPRFTLPLVAWGQEVRQAVCDVATYRLLAVRGYNPNAPADDQVRLRYEDALRAWREWGAGTAHPNVTDSSPGAQAGRGRVPRLITSSQRGFSSRGNTDVEPFTGD